MAAIPPSETSKGKYHHGDLRRALIDAALQLIAKQGISALTLREVAQQVGVSRMAPYRHFADKSALLAALAEEGFMALRATLDQAAQAEADPLERLQAIGVAYVSYAASHAAHYRVMFGSAIANKESYPALATAAEQAFGVLVQALATCQQSQRIRSADPIRQAQIAWSLVHGLAMLTIDNRLSNCQSIEALAIEATQTLIEGLSIATIS